MLLVLSAALLIGIQTFAFQSWLGKRGASWLSSELGTTISIKRIELEFFKRANLHQVLILDQHSDTLFSGDILAEISGFDYKHQKLNLDKLVLHNSTAKLIHYKKTDSYNFDFLQRYFASSDTSATNTSPWNVNYGEFKLNNVHLLYRFERDSSSQVYGIDYDNVELTHLSGSVENFRIKNDSLLFQTKALSFAERSGFAVNNLSGQFIVHPQLIKADNLVLKTPGSYVHANIEFSTTDWDDYNHFLTGVNMSASLFDSSRVNFADIAYFAPELRGLNKELSLRGNVKGTVSDLRLQKFSFRSGKHTAFTGDIQLTGLPDINSTYLHFNAKSLSTSYKDLAEIPSYPFTENQLLVIPAILEPCGKIVFKGIFDGFLSDFTTYGSITTDIGNLYTDISIQLPDNNKDINYHGLIETKQFNLGKLMGQADFSNLSLSANVEGKGINIADIEAEISGKVNSISYNNYLYKDIQLNGSFVNQVFNGLLVSKDPNADFDFNGSISFKNNLPQMDFISTLNRLDLRALNFTNPQDSGVFSSQILITLSGDNINNLSGSINFDNTRYKTNTKTYKLSTFDIQAEQNTPDKKIRLNSEYFNTTVLGHYKVENLAPAFKQLLHAYFPAMVPAPGKIKYSDDLDIYLRIKKFNVIHDLFLPDLMLSANTNLEGHFKAKENKLNVQVSSPLTNYTNRLLKDLVVIVNQSDSLMLVEASGKALNITDSLQLENFNLQVKGRDTALFYSIDWDNLHAPKNKGELKGKIETSNSYLKIINQQLAVVMSDSIWQQQQAASITIYTNGDMEFSPLTIAHNRQSVAISGRYSKRAEDNLQIGVNNIILEQFNGLLSLFSLNLKGLANGLVTVGHVGESTLFKGNLVLDKLYINENLIGELQVSTNYQSDENFLKLSGFSSLGVLDPEGNPYKNISFDGKYELEKKDENIDIAFSATPANIKLLNPFLEGILTIEKGFVNGKGRVHGNPDDIRIDGSFNLFNSEVKVDYTNVVYKLNGLIEIMPDQIRFSDIALIEKGFKGAPQGLINGNIFHRKFSNWQIDYDVTYKNMLVMNTTEKDNSLFYGKLYGTGRVGIYGYIDKLHMEIIDTTKQHSKFILPLDGPAEIDENDFVHFVKHDTIKDQPETSLSGFDLTMLLHATPDALAQIIIDNKSGDMLNVQGEGDLALSLNTLGKFEMVGDYKIKSGNYLFTLENIINKKFDIESGSSISWSGDPYNADINITTSYKQRASIAPLVNDPNYNARTQVDCKLLIGNKLFSPDINFAIDFPNLDATTKSRISSVLSDETELNRQVFSFLLFRTFATPLIYNTSQGGVTAGGAAANTGSELLSNRVTEFLNTYVGALSGIKDLELGLNYRPGSGTTNESVDLALSKQFLDNRITVDGNFGVNQNTSNGNSLIGDVNVDYKITNDGRFRLKGFNRSNDNTQIATAGGPYTQGVGFFYRVEFNTLEELWRSFLGKKTTSQTTGSPR